MTYYQSQVISLHQALYSKEHLLQQVMQAKNFIDLNFSNPISLQDIATHAHLSKFHFIRLFKRSYGRTPGQYLVSVRIREAKKLLATGLPVADVCFAIGFDSSTSFAGLFRKMTGLSPSAFRNKKQF